MVVEEAFLEEKVTLGEGATFLEEAEELVGVVTYLVVGVMLEVEVTFQEVQIKLEEEANLVHCLKIGIDWHWKMKYLTKRGSWMFDCLFCWNSRKDQLRYFSF